MVRKAALLIGINYKGTQSELNGCINDVKVMRKLLMKKYGYRSRQIKMLTDDSRYTRNKPYKSNIIRELRRLARKTTRYRYREVWLHYSGHGSFVYDTSGDEKDNRDEVMVPLDYEKRGFLKDDYLHRIFAKRISRRSKCISLFDCCYSGTILDLKYRNINGQKKIVENQKSGVRGNIMMISGCRDDQVSYDVYNLNNSKKYNGAMTASFTSSLKKHNYNISCFDLMKEMRSYLEKEKIPQVPQFTSSQPITEEMKFSSGAKKRGEKSYMVMSSGASVTKSTKSTTSTKINKTKRRSTKAKTKTKRRSTKTKTKRKHQ